MSAYCRSFVLFNYNLVIILSMYCKERRRTMICCKGCTGECCIVEHSYGTSYFFGVGTQKKMDTFLLKLHVVVSLGLADLLFVLRLDSSIFSNPKDILLWYLSNKLDFVAWWKIICSSNIRSDGEFSCSCNKVSEENQFVDIHIFTCIRISWLSSWFCAQLEAWMNTSLFKIQVVQSAKFTITTIKTSTGLRYLLLVNSSSIHISVRMDWLIYAMIRYQITKDPISVLPNCCIQICCQFLLSCLDGFFDSLQCLNSSSTEC